MKLPKQYFVILVVGAAGGVLASFFGLFLFDRNYLNSNSGLGALIVPRQTVERVEQRVVVTNREVLFARVLDNGYKSIAAIESFSGGKRLRYGSGIILTEDGFLVTLNSVVPVTADTYQIFIGDKIEKGKVVSRNYANNLALVAIQQQDLSPIDFSAEDPKLGSELIILGKHPDITGVNSIAIPAFVFEKSSTGAKLQASFDPAGYGGVVFNEEGKSVGILDWLSGRPKIISPVLIQSFFTEYLSR